MNRSNRQRIDQQIVGEVFNWRSLETWQRWIGGWWYISDGVVDDFHRASWDYQPPDFVAEAVNIFV